MNLPPYVLDVDHVAKIRFELSITILEKKTEQNYRLLKVVLDKTILPNDGDIFGNVLLSAFCITFSQFFNTVLCNGNIRLELLVFQRKSPLYLEVRSKKNDTPKCGENN